MNSLPTYDPHWEDRCKRCGQCCKLADGSDCQFLHRLPDGLTECTIYGRNWGVHIAIGYICKRIRDMDHIPIGCGYREARS